MFTLRRAWIVLLCVPAVLADEPVARVNIGNEPVIFSAKPLTVNQGDDELVRLLKDRYNSALKILQVQYLERKRGFEISIEELLKGSRRVVKTKLELSNTRAERIETLENHVEVVRFLERIHRAEYETVGVNAVALEKSTYWRLDAEIQLLRAKRAGE